jgi:hypothetical protein
VRLALEVVGSLLHVRRQLRRADLRATLSSLRGSPVPPERPASTGQELGEWLRLGRAVGRSLALLPGDTRCLTQSLVLTRLLARRGIGSKLVIGVRSGEQFGAHAWVEAGGQPLLPRGEATIERLVEL